LTRIETIKIGLSQDVLYLSYTSFSNLMNYGLGAFQEILIVIR